MTFSDLFKVMIIQRQITWKWYNIQLYFQWPISRKPYLSNGAIFYDLERPPYSSFKVMPFFDAEYLRNGTTYRRTNRDFVTFMSEVKSEY